MDESGIDAEADESVQEIDDLGQRVLGRDRLTQIGAEVFAGDAVQLRHQQQALRTDEVRRRIAPAVAAFVRTAHVLEHPVDAQKHISLKSCPLSSKKRHRFNYHWVGSLSTN